MTSSARAGFAVRFRAGMLAALWLALARGQEPSGPVWRDEAGFRWRGLEVVPGGQAGFTLLPAAVTGIGFSNRLEETTVARNRLLEIGSGVALGDVDGDDRVDIYLCRIEGTNALYRNLGGWRFVEITAEAGVGCPDQFSTGCALADVDGDGDLDLLVNSLENGTRLFLNDGHARFSEGADSGLGRRPGATSLALADVDGDGDLDLYVTRYRADTIHDHPSGLEVRSRREADGRWTIEPADRFVGLVKPDGGLELVERGEADVFYINRGQGRFAPIPWQGGVFLDEAGQPLAAPPTDWGLAVQFRDLNGDGLPDLYVCNDFVFWPDRLWLNVRSTRFQAAPRHALRCTSLSSMVADVADIDRDGVFDLFVADMLSPRRGPRAWQRPDTLAGTMVWPVEAADFRPEVPRNTLERGRGDGTFADVAAYAGVAATDWTWNSAFVDVDLDGWEDLLLATGTNHDVQDMDRIGRIVQSGGWKTLERRLESLRQLPRRPLPSIALRNNHNLTFADSSAAWGFNTVGIAQGMALADLDNDGDPDVVVNVLNGPVRILRNNSPVPRLAVRLRSAAGNTHGIGARIVVTGGPVRQMQEMVAGGRYLSCDDALRIFAAGAPSMPMGLEVVWRSGRQSIVPDIQANRLYEIREPVGTPPAALPTGPPAPAPLFENVSARLNHKHSDIPFDDFGRQPLLPRRLSTPGPGIAWLDANGDGWDDLAIGGGKGGRLGLFLNDGAGRFRDSLPASDGHPNLRDQIGLATWYDPDGQLRIAVGESNWEDADTNAPPLRFVQVQPGGTWSLVASPPYSGRSATGPVAVADVDGEGTLEVFVGGRVVAGRYPEPADSLLLRQGKGTFQVAQSFPKLGRVSGAVFTDLDGDGDPDLVVVGEWDPIRVFRNEHGRLNPWSLEIQAAGPIPSPQSGARLDDLVGWWTGVAAGDFDGDGRMDLVVSNWGNNWRLDQTVGNSAPVLLYHGEFAGDGVLQTLLASIDPDLGQVAPWRERDAVVAALPSVAGRLPDYHSYGRASIADVLGENTASAGILTATAFETRVFLNRGARLESRPLPIEAQLAPAFGVATSDFDGDGRTDVFLAQNFFGVDAETSRQDAGTGLVLLGDGEGGFRPLSPGEAGVFIPGEQRGCAVADFDGDGRVDLAVAQHAGTTQLLRNVRGARGVRVSVRGPAANPVGIGARIRLRFGDRWSPMQEIQAGSGYGSQDSTTRVFGVPAMPSAIEVRMPWGVSQIWPWPDGALAVEVSAAGVKQRLP